MAFLAETLDRVPSPMVKLFSVKVEMTDFDNILAQEKGNHV